MSGWDAILGAIGMFVALAILAVFFTMGMSAVKGECKKGRVMFIDGVEYRCVKQEAKR